MTADFTLTTSTPALQGRSREQNAPARPTAFCGYFRSWLLHGRSRESRPSGRGGRYLRRMLDRSDTEEKDHE